MSLQIVTPSAGALISTADAKAHLRVIETAEDALIDRLVGAAHRWAEHELGRSFVNETWDETFRRFPASADDPMILAQSPVSSIISVTYFDADDTSTVWPIAEWDEHAPDHLRGSVVLAPGFTWPAVRADRAWPVTVRYVAGYGALASDVPGDIVQAVYLVLDDMYRLRGASTATKIQPITVASVRSLLLHHDTGTYP